jgi:hypothetical protein
VTKLTGDDDASVPAVSRFSSIARSRCRWLKSGGVRSMDLLLPTAPAAAAGLSAGVPRHLLLLLLTACAAATRGRALAAQQRGSRVVMVAACMAAAGGECGVLRRAVARLARASEREQRAQRACVRRGAMLISQGAVG